MTESGDEDDHGASLSNCNEDILSLPRRVQSEAVEKQLCGDENENEKIMPGFGMAGTSLIDRSLISVDALKFLEKHNIKTGNTQQLMK